jgi:hypothetical protein
MTTLTPALTIARMMRRQKGFNEWRSGRGIGWW